MDSLASQTITLIAGNVASGKTYLGRKIAERTDAILIDDPFHFHEIKCAIEYNPGKDIVICDPWLCDERLRAKAELKLKELSPKSKLVWIFFENNPSQCLKNITLRNDGRKLDERSVKRFSELYRIPDGAITIPVYNTDGT